MKNRNLIVLIIVVVILSAIATFALTRLLERPASAISREIIVDRIEEQAFLVSNTVYLDEEVSVEIPRSSSLDEFFRGKTVTAEAMVRSDIGVDLQDIDEAQIEIDRDNQLITISGVEPEILDSSIFGDIEIEVSGTILTLIFDRTNEDDYNLARNTLVEAANETIQEDEDLQEEVLSNSSLTLNQLFDASGYKLLLTE